MTESSQAHEGRKQEFEDITDKIQRLGFVLRAERKRQKVTQKQLTMLSGVGERFIRELEQGKRSCHIGKAFQVAASLGVEIVVGGRKL